MSLPSHISGFTPIPVQYSSTSTSTHYIYARAHNSSKKATAQPHDAALPEGRTLFLVNVPPDATEREITLLFKPSGTVERVLFGGDGIMEEEAMDDSEGEGSDEEPASEAEAAAEAEHPRKKRKISKDGKSSAPQVLPLPLRTTRALRRTGRSAHVIFLDSSSLSRALSVPVNSKPRSWPSDPEAPSGLAHYTALYVSLRPPLDVVKAHADSWMDLFEYEQAKKRQRSKYKKGEAIVDNDGFTLVTRGGAYGQTVGGGVGVASKKFQQTGSASQRTRKNKKEPKEKDSFYAFQIHEKKRKGGHFVCSVRAATHLSVRAHGPQEEVGRRQGKGREAQRKSQVPALLVLAYAKCTTYLLANRFRPATTLALLHF